MIHIPEPDLTPDGPRYQGRPLARSDEEVVDQGATFDVATLLTRRRMLSLVGMGAGAAILAACAPAPTTTSSPTASGSAGADEIPDETAGPYPGDGSNGPDVLERSGIVRSDIRSSIGGGATADGVPLAFTLTVTDMANGDAPFAGVAVYAWHCDAEGRYSMYSDGVEDETYLRGVQVADADGRVAFTSIFPACYTGRWPHIHFEVYPDVEAITDAGNAIAISQLALPEAACAAVYADPRYDGSARNLSQVTLASDNVFGDDGGALQLATVSGSVERGYEASLLVRVDTRTPVASGSATGSGGMPGRPGGGPGEPPGDAPPRS
ncbi:intradiol ring-cleavage dioxygenase [Protaetiibacter sp. SSC-01]|uniref:intradiol ring-cleavage dioxygenase n=1 Tax=Protaetiibacter sp. SSC-01 TaxID=2759943 RepID=UPI001657154A|nr:intradiol ring-cleavage dioxygenase [Protaetiibacter sp. SSC-01]QNO37627.1 intradiol ring-cleavage dioxygenase [Protaetiibacter sp. SSC-01]